MTIVGNASPCRQPPLSVSLGGWFAWIAEKDRFQGVEHGRFGGAGCAAESVCKLQNHAVATANTSWQDLQFPLFLAENKTVLDLAGADLCCSISIVPAGRLGLYARKSACTKRSAPRAARREPEADRNRNWTHASRS